jgi:hypothetical protein
MKRTFFEHLGVAHLEKIHTQTISWILSNQNDGLDKSEKEKLLSKLFNLENFEVKKNITEFEKIDLILKSDSTIACIENKLNSSLHSQQLENYEKTIKSLYPDLEHKFYFLSLINERSKSKIWKSITYSKLLNTLKEVEINNNGNGVIIQEYIRTIENFDLVLNSFLRCPEKFPNVFKDGYKSKSVKLNESIIEGEQEFIRNNQLETIFQKLYYQKVAEKLELQNYYIDETRGNAILGINYKQALEIKGKKINIGFDFQGGTFKIYCAAAEYKTSKPSDVPIEIVEILQKNGLKLKNYRFNKPRSKGHFSITNRRKELFGIKIEHFADAFKREMKVAEDIIENEILHTLANNGYRK